jgi:hypothetical protein
MSCGLITLPNRSKVRVVPNWIRSSRCLDSRCLDSRRLDTRCLDTRCLDTRVGVRSGADVEKGKDVVDKTNVVVVLSNSVFGGRWTSVSLAWLTISVVVCAEKSSGRFTLLNRFGHWNETNIRSVHGRIA